MLPYGPVGSLPAVITSYVEIDVLQVSPAIPTENFPIAIDFKVLNHTSKTQSGVVRFPGQQTADGPSTYQVNGLGPGRSLWGTVWGLAPAAGLSQEIYLRFEPQDTNTIVTRRGLKTMDVKATYELWITELVCKKPRSLDKDTLIGVCSASYGGKPLPPKNPHPLRPFEDQLGLQTESYGDHGSGSTIPVHFVFGPFDSFPGEDKDLTFTHIFSNMGGGPDAARQGMQITGHLAAAIGSATGPIGAAIGGLIDGVLQGISSILQNCNGQVASDKFRMKSSEMYQATAENGQYVQTDSYDGTPSPAVCGEASSYQVRWNLGRGSYPYGPV